MPMFGERNTFGGMQSPGGSMTAGPATQPAPQPKIGPPLNLLQMLGINPQAGGAGGMPPGGPTGPRHQIAQQNMPGVPGMPPGQQSGFPGPMQMPQEARQRAMQMPQQARGQMAAAQGGQKQGVMQQMLANLQQNIGSLTPQQIQQMTGYYPGGAGGAQARPAPGPGLLY